MADGTHIEWADATWNPVAGCSLKSPGCTHCYAMPIAHRLGIIVAGTFEGLTRMTASGPVWTGIVRPHPPALNRPMRWTRPRRIFVNSMSDLFHEDLPDEVIDEVFGVMALCPHHEFLVLTKRSANLRRWSEQVRKRSAMTECVAELYVNHPETAERWPFDAARAIGVGLRGWPLPHVVLGVSVEDQARADERREDLLTVAAAGWRTFVSYEPALGPVDWRGWEFLKGLISGGESGPRARPSHPDWHRAARDFCAAHGIAYFFKQWGEWIAAEEVPLAALARDAVPGMIEPCNDATAFAALTSRRVAVLRRVGKKAAGRLLDGRDWSEFPGMSTEADHG